MSDIYLWETYDRLGREALNNRDLEQAVESFRSAVATAEEIGAHDRLALSLRNLAAVYVDLGQLGDAHELLNRTLELSQAALGSEHSQTVETKRDLSRVCRELGFLEKSEGYLQQVLEHEKEHATPQEVDATLVGLAQLCQARSLFDKAASYFEEVVDLRSQNVKDNQPRIAQALLWLSTSLFRGGKVDLGTEHLSTAFAMLERQYAEEPLYLAQSLLAGSQMLVEAGQLETALPHQKRALDLLIKSVGGEDEKAWEARELIATTLAGKGQTAEAIELLEYCAEHNPALGDHKKGALLKNLAGLYLTLNKLEKADKLYAEAAELLEKTVGADHPAYLATLEERIQFYHMNGRPKEALELALKTIRATENRFGPGHPNTAQVYASTALLAHNAQEWNTALELMRAAEKIWMSLRPVPEDVLANCRTNIATCLMKMGQLEEAESMLDRAEEGAVPSLRPVIANLREQLSAGKSVEASSSAPQEEEDEFSLPDIESMLDEPMPKSDTVSSDSMPDPEYDLPDIDDFLNSDSDEDKPQQPAPTPEADETAVKPKKLTLRLKPSAKTPPKEEAVAEPEPAEETIAVNGELEEVVSAEVSEAAVSAEPEPAAVEQRELEENAEEIISPEEPPPVSESEVEVIADKQKEVKPKETESVGQPIVNGEPVERRSSPRIPLTFNKFFDLKVKLEDDEQQESVRSFLVDLAPGGIRINSEEPLPTEEEVALTLPPEVLGEETELKARVVWQKPLYGASYLQGLSFQELTTNQQDLLDKKLETGSGSHRGKGRQHFRLYRPFPIKVRAPGHDEWIRSYATDLSIDGLGTRLREPLSKEDHIRLRLELEFELPTVEVEAKVAWSSSGENGVSHGIQFAEVGPVEAKTIKRYIDHCLEFSIDD